MTDQRSQEPGFLDFERPIVELELRLARLQTLAERQPELLPGLGPLKAQIDRLRIETFARLSRWQIVQLARHQQRPTALAYIERLFPDFVPLFGDRLEGDDPALVGGPASLAGRSVMVIAHARGSTADEDRTRNYGMTSPSGFRKAARLAQLANRLGLPIITLLDTPSASPGADAEEHGQALAIAGCIEALAVARVPIVACVVGEGGSGGALALSVSDRLLMLEYSIFEVISPEACSTILFRTPSRAEQMADALHLTAKDLVALQLVDEIVPEPPGGAHRDRANAAALLGQVLQRVLASLCAQPVEERLAARRTRVRRYGAPALPEKDV